MESQLVVIDSQAKNEYLIEVLSKVLKKPQNLWLGANDEFSSSRNMKRPFYWSATGQLLKYNFWTKNNPDNYNKQEHCVHIWDNNNDFKWNDNECTKQMGFICESNRYSDLYYKKWSQVCDAFASRTAKMIKDFTEVKQHHNTEITDKTEHINTEIYNVKTDFQEVHNNTQTDIVKLLATKEQEFKVIAENMLQQVGDLNEEFKKSMAIINTKFTETLSEKPNEIEQSCSLFLN